MISMTVPLIIGGFLLTVWIGVGGTAAMLTDRLNTKLLKSMRTGDTLDIHEHGVKRTIKIIEVTV